MSTPVLRLASEADLPAIVEIYNRTIPTRQVTADLEPVSVESRRTWFHEHLPEKRPLWVLEEVGAVCAWLSFTSFRPRPAYNCSAEISLYIAETHRRRGHGRRLLGEAISRAPNFGLTNLVGLIWAHNEPSLHLFAAYGFERWGHLPRIARLDEVERDLVIVGRRVAN